MSKFRYNLPKTTPSVCCDMFWLKHKTSRDTPLVTERQLSSFFAFVRHNNKDRESVHLLPFSRRFRRKTRLLHWLVFFSSIQRDRSTFCALCNFTTVVHYALSTSFSTHSKPLTRDEKPFQSKRTPFPRFSTL